MLSVRVATVDDIDAILDLETRCWRESHDELAETLQAPDGAAVRRRRWADRIVTIDREVRLADDDGTLVGVVSWGDGATGDHRGLELKSLTVDAGYQGAGLDSDLLELVPADEAIFVWAVRDDAQARRFYEHAGFIDTEQAGADVDTGVDTVMMVRGDLT